MKCDWCTNEATHQNCGVAEAVVCKDHACKNCQPLESVGQVSDHLSAPTYYTWHPVCECRDITQHFSYNIGSAIAYLWRAGRKTKDPTEDYNKALEFIQAEIRRHKK